MRVTAIWLLPFYPSPRKDDGYDIADYRGVHPDYGTLQDARRFVREAELLRLAGSVERGSEHPLGEITMARIAERFPGTVRDGVLDREALAAATA